VFSLYYSVIIIQKFSKTVVSLFVNTSAILLIRLKYLIILLIKKLCRTFVIHSSFDELICPHFFYARKFSVGLLERCLVADVGSLLAILSVLRMAMLVA